MLVDMIGTCTRSLSIKGAFVKIWKSVLTFEMGTDALSVYRNGLEAFLNRDYVKAYTCFTKSARNHCGPALTAKGLLLQEGLGTQKDHSAAIKCWRKAANLGHVDARYKVGIGILHGNVTGVDKRKGLGILQQAALDQHPNAEYDVGWVHYFGQIVRQDLEKCFYWYRRAAIHGHHEAQYCMGQANDHRGEWLGENRIVRRNPERAQFWFRQAADIGFYPALGLLGRTTPDQYEAEFHSLRKSAPEGDASTQLRLGKFHYYSVGVLTPNIQRDFYEAVRWFYRSAVQGHAEAQNQLGLALRFGNGAPQDYDEAARWFTRAAEQGNRDAQFNLGRSFRYRGWRGLNDENPHSAAAKWFLAAAEQGHPFAQWAIANAYAQGDGVKQSRWNAKAWYQRAIQSGVYDAQKSYETLRAAGVI